MNSIKSPVVENQQTSQPEDQVTDRQLLEVIYVSVEKTRKYIFWLNIITITFFVVPLLIALIAAPFFIRSFSSYMNLLPGG